MNLKRDYNKSILCCMSGGGYRMMECATGVLQAIDRAGVKIHRYMGASAGGIMSGLHASGMKGDDIETLIRRTPASSLMRRSVRAFLPFVKTEYVYTREPMREMIRSHISDTVVWDTVKVSATERDTKKTVMLNGGVDAFMATSAIPEVFPPVEINGVWYVDGGVKNNIPIPKIVDIPSYEMIIIVMCNDGMSAPSGWCKTTRSLSWLDASMSREFCQIWESWTDLPNVVIIQPPPFESSLMDWSDGFKLIEHARNHAMSVL